jgi:hypothetical protein
LEFGDLLRQTKYAKRVSGPNRGLSGRIDESFSIQTVDGDDCYAEAFTHCASARLWPLFSKSPTLISLVTGKSPLAGRYGSFSRPDLRACVYACADDLKTGKRCKTLDTRTADASISG